MLPLPPLPEPLPEHRLGPSVEGDRLLIGGQKLRSSWSWQGSNPDRPKQLWLPLDVLESQLGFRRIGGELEWFGRRRTLIDIPRITLGDEVGLDVAEWLLATGVNVRRDGSVLELTLPTARLEKMRRGKGKTAARLVLDLDAPLLVQRLGDDLYLGLHLNPAQRHTLERLGLRPQLRSQGVLLPGQATRLKSLSLAQPWRLVLDGVNPGTSATATPQTLHSPAVAVWLRRGLVLERRMLKVGVKPLELVRAGGDLPTIGLGLKPLTKANTQTGLQFLPQLAQSARAVVAVNGGFFNRIIEVPLGALRLNNRWLSGPILNRGVIAWTNSRRLRFGRLKLQQTLWSNTGQGHRIDQLNSGYVQRGLSRYTRDWGPVYRPLSGQEEAILIHGGVVKIHIEHDRLKRGVAIPETADLLVARGGTALPAKPGDQVWISKGSRSGLDQWQHVLGGGPLLLQNGRIVLDGRAEGFSPGFLALTAPRTVVGQGRGGTWLMTLRGTGGDSGGPTLLETALAAKQLGLQDALNLDGGSSTTVVAGGHTVMNGRAGTPRVHNGLGLVPL